MVMLPLAVVSVAQIAEEVDESSDVSSDEVIAAVSVVVDSSFSAQEIMVRLKPKTKIMYKTFFIF